MVYVTMIMLTYLFTLKNSMLMYLIGLEFLMVTLLFYLLVMDELNYIFSFVLIYSVCEVVFGLSLMVSMVVGYGHQKFLIMNLC